MFCLNSVKNGIPNIRKQSRQTQEPTGLESYETLEISQRQHSQISSVYQFLAKPELNEITNSDIILQSLITSGVFYGIRNGQLKTEENLSFDIIIKEVKNLNIFWMQYLREQAVAMCKLRRNDYTMACFGISQDNKYLLMENASCGNIQMYLKEQTDNSYYNMKKVDDHLKIINFIQQIIRGIKSVLEMQPPALFYSLSASHVLITNQEQCKLTGFATSTAVNQREKLEEQDHVNIFSK
ncbi:hypothetical protein LSH36_1681g00010 [Paralvinella palmiformis]|uniref:Serine-threonine/tyrosine-protein kinase catalytic domain-containing protein n=1 Tax=Paralvinella palmiformis TaxID=53620 RepID=A0AAD9MN86_9ANNE|nr:hypothetical protein LSH36_1681g00010 [Paralvinella palmiformis]